MVLQGRCSSSQSIIITVTDSCPECEADHIDLQALTFNKVTHPSHDPYEAQTGQDIVVKCCVTDELPWLQIAPMSIGRIDIKYRRVDCTPPNPVTIEIDNNVGVGGWLRLVVEVTPLFKSKFACNTMGVRLCG